jgi:hypothetical protein
LPKYFTVSKFSRLSIALAFESVSASFIERTNLMRHSESMMETSLSVVFSIIFASDFPSAVYCAAMLPRSEIIRV